MITERVVKKLQEAAAHERILADNARTSDTLARLATKEQRDELDRVARECDALADELIEAIRLLQPHVQEAPEQRRRRFGVLRGGRS